jgi:CRP-like cAMP-binding protein
MAGGRYSLTAVTLKESELAFIDRQALLDHIKDDPGLGLELVRALGEEVLHMRTILAPAPSSK